MTYFWILAYLRQNLGFGFGQNEPIFLLVVEGFLSKLTYLKKFSPRIPCF